MTARVTALRTALRNKLLTDRDAGQFVRNDFTITQSYFPREDLESLTEPRVALAPMGFDIVRLTRSGAKDLNDLPVQVALQAKVDPNDTDALDALVELYEQLMAECEDDTLVAGYYWLRTEALKDENGLCYDFGRLRASHTFEAYYTAFWKTVEN